MGSFFDRIGYSIKAKKWLLILVVGLSLVMIGLAVYSAVQFGANEIVINLNNIAIIKFLKGESGLFACIFLSIISVLIFYFLILIFYYKVWLIPIGLGVYLYYVYSQAVVVVSVIMIYGFLNCLLVVVMLTIYCLVIMAIMVLSIIDFSCIDRCGNYFVSCFNLRDSNTLLYIILIVVFISLFVLVLSIMKSFMILLIY